MVTGVSNYSAVRAEHVTKTMNDSEKASKVLRELVRNLFMPFLEKPCKFLLLVENEVDVTELVLAISNEHIQETTAWKPDTSTHKLEVTRLDSLRKQLFLDYVLELGEKFGHSGSFEVDNNIDRGNEHLLYVILHQGPHIQVSKTNFDDRPSKDLTEAFVRIVKLKEFFERILQELSLPIGLEFRLRLALVVLWEDLMTSGAGQILDHNSESNEVMLVVIVKESQRASLLGKNTPSVSLNSQTISGQILEQFTSDSRMRKYVSAAKLPSLLLQCGFSAVQLRRKLREILDE